MNSPFKFQRILFSVFLLLLSVKQTVFCQIQKNQQYIQGGIITLGNDTLKGVIEKKSEVDMQFRISFTVEAEKKSIYKPRQIKGYYLIEKEDTIFFESFEYWKSCQFINKHFFVKKMSAGKISLYLYKEEGFNFTAFGKTTYYYYFLKKDNNWIKSKPITAYNFKNKLKLYLKDCDPILLEINNPNLFIDDLPALFKNYNRLCLN